MSIIDYSTIPLKKIFENLKTSKEGLPGNEVKLRLKMYGYNVLAQKKELGIVLEFLSHFLSPLIVILFFAAGISAYFGEITNAIIVGIMILASVTLDFFVEHSANNVAEKLREKVSITATVIRDGLKQEVKAINICVGDIIFLSSGDLIPADARIIESDDFFVNQSSLTGESFPREKFPAFIKGELDSNLVFLGSNVISGTALAVVFAIGQATAFGKISQAILGKPVKSEFELGINHFGFFITKVILFLVLFIFLFNALLHHN
ncbi:MAG: cation-transporting P-type ATPase, partial [Candidatus Falkowbacteria bacterium]|nr:cation-transporting P-type ATPase [Candidatus Falkowbacteria bacterium]